MPKRLGVTVDYRPIVTLARVLIAIAFGFGIGTWTVAPTIAASSSFPATAAMPTGPQGTIAFVRADGSGTTIQSAIFLVDATSGKSKRIAPWTHDTLSGLSWSPDGARLLYVDSNSSAVSLILVHADGTKPMTLRSLAVTSYASDPAWSPDGTQIALDIADSSGLYSISILTLKGTTVTGEQKLPTPAPLGDVVDPQAFQPSWSPDGKRLAFIFWHGHSVDTAAVGNVWIEDSDGKNQRAVTTDPVPPPPPAPDPYGNWERPRWSPDGSAIVVGRIGFGTWEQYLLSPSSTTQTQLTHSPQCVAAQDARWSPDSRWLVYGYYNFNDSPTPTQQCPASSKHDALYLIKRDGSGDKQLTTVPRYVTDEWSAWMPASSHIWSVTFDQGDRVIEDRHGPKGSAALPTRKVEDFTPKNCGSASPAADWLDCETPVPNGTPEKNWPVLAVKDQPLRIKEARFRLLGPLKSPVVEAEIDLGDGTILHIPPTPGKVQGNEAVFDNLATTEMLPGVAVLHPVIQWKVGTQVDRVPAGTSTHPVYVAFSEPVHPTSENEIFLSTLDLAVRAASGKQSADDVVSAVNGQFATLANYPRILNEQTGKVKIDTSAPLKYYDDDWSLEKAVKGAYLDFIKYASCARRGELNILQTLVGRCGNWGDFFADALGDLGVQSSSVTAGYESGFPAGPQETAGFTCAGSGLNTENHQTYMLINTWNFSGTGTSGDPNFPYQDIIRVSTQPANEPSKKTWKPIKLEFDYSSSKGQAHPLAPGWFHTGDHQIVKYGGQYYDPSYGSGPFANLGDWGSTALAGYAECTKTESKDKKTVTFVIDAHKGTP